MQIKNLFMFLETNKSLVRSIIFNTSIDGVLYQFSFEIL